MTVEIIKDPQFEPVAEGVKPDAKHRVLLKKTKLPPGVTYRIYANRLGQIVLDPQVNIPASEAWLYADDEAITAVRRGLAAAVSGDIIKIDPDEL
ncbi:MAG: hypothetical protein P3T54_02930 [Dehalogenimonas sp.]|uniref:Uncharacterized protein n=1 Tax=Candidatus Dehalogenimonas loeffleri TaxID=3127115 RepID=A0ABZ2J1G8_9CHLR|nr:hypothetical protein [Dehalogenimonas sp.]